MKKIIYPLLVLFLSSCGGASNNDSDLQQLIEQRNKLRDQYDELNKEIGKLDEKIAERDTTRRKTLVTVVPAVVDTFKHYFEVYGNVDVKRNALLIPESQGAVKEILAEEGDRVSKGQVILRLDNELIKKNIAEVNTNYDLAKSLFDRQERLWNQNIGSEVQYLEAKNRKESIERSLATLQEQLDKTAVRAPFTGVLDEVMIKIGEMASPGAPVARLLDLSEFHIEADVTESYASTVKKGSEVEVIFPGVDTLQAEITNVGSFINPANRTFRIKVKVAADNGRFKPNQLTVLRINDLTFPEAVILPTDVIQQDAKGKDFVFVADKTNGSNATVIKTNIEAGSFYGGKAQVVSGLSGGELIIDRGSRSVRDTQEVEITDN